METQETANCYREVDEAEQSTIARHLCAFQRRMLIESLVQSFAACTRYVPENAERVFDAGELPPVLERVSLHVETSWQAWFAWTDGQRTWFLVAEMASAPNRNCQDESVRIFFYDERGRVASSGTWIFHIDGSWELHPT